MLEVEVLHFKLHAVGPGLDMFEAIASSESAVNTGLTFK